MFLEKGVLKKCSKFTGEHPCRSTISIKLLCNFIEIALRHGCSPVNLLNIFRTPFLKNTSGWLLFKLLFSFPSFPVAFLTKPYNCKHSSSIFVISFFVEQFHFLITWFCSLRRVSIQIPN